MALVNSDPDLDWTVILTRHENDDDDHTVEITERKRIAKEQELQHPGEVFFLSIHCNAYGDGTGFYDSHGTEAFYCTQTYNSNNQLINRYASPYVCNMRFC
jgi:N-acetylmuramoyl-L-alanine amidase